MKLAEAPAKRLLHWRNLLVSRICRPVCGRNQLLEARDIRCHLLIGLLIKPGQLHSP
jgi:hypothetical protein